MSILMTLKRWVSYVSPFPVFKGYGFTIDDTVVPKRPDLPNLNNLIFYTTRQDLGAFELRQVISKQDDKISYVIYHIDTGQEFKMNKKWFEFFFEELPLPPTTYGQHDLSNSSDKK